MNWFPEWLILPTQLAYLGLLITTFIRIATERELGRGWKTIWFILILALPIVAMIYWYANAGTSKGLKFGQGIR